MRQNNRKHRREHRRSATQMMDTIASFGIAHVGARNARKTGPLCKEVARTLACVLGAARDPRLRELAVVAVEPAPDAARLLVTLFARTCAPSELPQLRERLQSLRGPLRTEVAAALQRRRAPDLAFHVALAATSEPAAEARERAA
jgi:ribosome-binding factor A